MIRRVLTVWLVVAVGVAPLLCCCTAGRSSAAAPAKPTAPSRTEVSSPCCGHKGHPAKPAPSSPKPGDHCPCKHHAGDTPTIRAESASADLSSLLRAATAPDLVAPFALVADLLSKASLPSVARGADTPRLSTADLLFAHHNLRC